MKITGNIHPRWVKKREECQSQGEMNNQYVMIVSNKLDIILCIGESPHSFLTRLHASAHT